LSYRHEHFSTGAPGGLNTDTGSCIGEEMLIQIDEGMFV
jgi:hypothetical protein